MEAQNTCANCNNNFTGKYCNNCGQAAGVHRFTFAYIFEEVFHAFTHADKSFLVFIKKLLLQPGKVAYEYIVENKKKRYFNPFTFFLIISAANAFVTGFDLSLKEKLFHANNEYGHIFNVYDKILALVTIPIIALVFWALNVTKTRLRYSEYTVYAMLIISLLSMVSIAEHALNYVFTYLQHHFVDIEDTRYNLALLLGYLTFADHQFNKQLHTASWVKSFIAAVMWFVIVFSVQLFIVYAVLNNFTGIGHFGGYGIQVN